MIEDRHDLFDRIRSFGWTPTTDSYETKLEALDMALTLAVSGVVGRLGGDVHLNLSGGVDSTLLLYRLRAVGCMWSPSMEGISKGHPWKSFRNVETNWRPLIKRRPLSEKL